MRQILVRKLSKYLELTTGLKHIFEDKLLNHIIYKELGQFLKDT